MMVITPERWLLCDVIQLNIDFPRPTGILAAATKPPAPSLQLHSTAILMILMLHSSPHRA